MCVCLCTCVWVLRMCVRVFNERVFVCVEYMCMLNMCVCVRVLSMCECSEYVCVCV